VTAAAAMIEVVVGETVVGTEPPAAVLDRMDSLESTQGRHWLSVCAVGSREVHPESRTEV
jgi:hypothetical protein